MLKAWFYKEPDPKELVRKWQSNLRAQQRSMDRSIRGKYVGTDQACIEGAICSTHASFTHLGIFEY